MNPQTTSLFIGRFQPFHNGHLDAIRQIFDRGDTQMLLIGIGSAEENFTPDNPLTAGNRFQMISESLQEAGVSREKYNICPIRNIGHYGLWPHHVQHLLPKFSRVFSGSPLVRRLFEEQIPDIEVIELINRTNISGTDVRKNITEGIYPTDALPKASLEFLKKIHAKQLLQDIERTGFDP